MKLQTTWKRLKPNVLLSVRDLLPTIEYDGSKQRLLIQPVGFAEVSERNKHRRRENYNTIRELDIHRDV
jgi:hypothetical protein